ncbi:hypothetical protein EAX61_01575 [Dokdonia sinensis]|uniref:Uncharacterized protein n=1 Tax=Dokdonia sinensis TaxID=2479847 RepID=A0A3M0GMY6_9FLAO|nr:hypothetical protein [Dokdonia sinensis]RMB64092.1 hypothetical protein EAX61_01575 [Dokdonia sinensis]
MMFTQLNTQQKLPLTGFAFSIVNYEVRDIVSLFYKASHTKKSVTNDEWIIDLERQLENLKVQQSTRGALCNTGQSQLRIILKKVIQAVTQFEISYKANCPCAGVLPSPFILRVQRIGQKAKLALLYIEV